LLRINWLLSRFRSVSWLSTYVRFETGETAKQHVDSIAACVLYPTLWFEEDQKGATFSVAPNTSFGDQFAFHYN